MTNTETSASSGPGLWAVSDREWVRRWRLDRKSSAALLAVLRAWRRRNQHRDVLADADAALSEAVRDALDAGVPAATIAAGLGVHRNRVYQLRDGTR